MDELSREVYDRLTALFNDFGFKPSDAPEAYNELTEARSMLEGICPWSCKDRAFLGQLLLSIECLVEAVVKLRKPTGNPTVQEEENGNETRTDV